MSTEQQTAGASTRPRVAIGLPVYNGDRFVAEAMQSVRSQSVADIEILVADNASTDATMAICSEHADADPRVVILPSDLNRGAAWNFNRLVDETDATYFKWAAHDDLIEPDFVERCLAVMEADPGIVLCYGRAVDIDGDGSVLGPIVSEPYATSADPVERAASLLRIKSSCVEVFGLIRRDQLLGTDRIGPYTSSDRTLLFELALRGRFHEIDAVLIRRRQHDGRSVRSAARDRTSWFDTSRRDGFALPKWRLVAEFHRAVYRAPLTRSQRAKITLLVARWTASQSVGLGRELAGWGRDGVVRVAHRVHDSVRRPGSSEYHGMDRAGEVVK